jgi:hypothetical protein
MGPVQLLYERDAFVIVHECVDCGATRRCRTSSDDDLTSFGL